MNLAELPTTYENASLAISAPTINPKIYKKCGVEILGKTLNQTHKGKADCAICFESKPLASQRFCRVCNSNGICAGCYRKMLSTNGTYVNNRIGENENIKCPCCRALGCFGNKGELPTKVIVLDDVVLRKPFLMDADIQSYYADLKSKTKMIYNDFEKYCVVRDDKVKTNHIYKTTNPEYLSVNSQIDVRKNEIARLEMLLSHEVHYLEQEKQKQKKLEAQNIKDDCLDIIAEQELFALIVIKLTMISTTKKYKDWGHIGVFSEGLTKYMGAWINGRGYMYYDGLPPVDYRKIMDLVYNSDNSLEKGSDFNTALEMFFRLSDTSRHTARPIDFGNYPNDHARANWYLHKISRGGGLEFDDGEEFNERFNIKPILDRLDFRIKKLDDGWATPKTPPDLSAFSEAQLLEALAKMKK
tara:strand:+ start:243 stop:1484 length:1242 start_codon:yes stop_codon:yes gene_type:complete